MYMPNQGNQVENDCTITRPRFEMPRYLLSIKANGNMKLVGGYRLFFPGDYPNRNVVFYGNKSNNSRLVINFKNSPGEVFNNKLILGVRKV